MAFNITPQILLSAAGNAVNLVTNVQKVDIVAILDQETNTQVFNGARPIKASVRETATVMKYPVETGSIISDHRISNPTEIEIVCIIGAGSYSSAYQAIRTAWLNATLLSVQTRTGTYRNMIISDLPQYQDPDMYNAVTLAIKFYEVIIVAPSSIAVPQDNANYLPTDPQNAITVNRGLLSAIAAPGSAIGYFNALSVWGK